MKKSEKSELIAELTEEIAATPHIYFTDASTMNVAQVNTLRRMCYDQGIRYQVVKNTFIRKALEAQKTKDLSSLPKETLKGATALFFDKEQANGCAKLIQAFRKNEGLELPRLKAACIEQDIYSGEAQLNVLSSLKSKTEWLSEVLGLLQSPSQKVLAMLSGPAQKLAGALHTLAKRKI